jgi:glutaminyl-peptide cyclotransferase
MRSSPSGLRRIAAGVLSLLALGFSCCGKSPSGAATAAVASVAPSPPPVSATAEVPNYTYEVVNIWPHDRSAFTEGLVYLQGILLESTGMNGASTLRKVDLQTGAVLQEVKLSAEYFGEGTAVLGDKIYQLTYQSHKGFVYDLASMNLEREFPFTGEGWGLATDGKSLIMSDGTNQIRFLDPATCQVTRTISVFIHGDPLKMINELEYIKGEIFANIWQTELVARIDPATGQLLGLIDFSGLLPNHPDFLNGIAYDAQGDRLFVTGKYWPKLFEVRLKLK